MTREIFSLSLQQLLLVLLLRIVMSIFKMNLWWWKCNFIAEWNYKKNWFILLKTYIPIIHHHMSHSGLNICHWKLNLNLSFSFSFSPIIIFFWFDANSSWINTILVPSLRKKLLPFWILIRPPFLSLLLYGLNS